MAENQTTRAYTQECRWPLTDAPCRSPTRDWFAEPFDFAHGQADGYGKTIEDCRSKFDNVGRFAGFPIVPEETRHGAE